MVGTKDKPAVTMATPPNPRVTDEIRPAPPSVSTDMEEIFPNATRQPARHVTGHGPRPMVSSATPVGGRRSQISPTTLGGLTAVVFAVLSAGAVFLSRPQSSLAPVSPGPRPVNSSATPAPAPTPAAPIRLTPVSGGPSHPIAAPVPRRTRARLTPHARPSHVVARTDSSPADLLSADRRLRRAYIQAVSAGVPQPVLVEYRDRWADLRDEATWRPDRVAIGYNAMASDLTRMSDWRRAHRLAPRPDSDRGW